MKLLVYTYINHFIISAKDFVRIGVFILEIYIYILKY